VLQRQHAHSLPSLPGSRPQSARCPWRRRSLGLVDKWGKRMIGGPLVHLYRIQRRQTWSLRAATVVVPLLAALLQSS
jgi:hypothetical protein